MRGLRGRSCPMLMLLRGSRCSPRLNGCLGKPPQNFSLRTWEQLSEDPAHLPLTVHSAAILKYTEELSDKTEIHRQWSYLLF